MVTTSVPNGLLAPLGREIFPRKVFKAGVNEYYSVELVAMDILFSGFVSFRLLDENGKIRAPRICRDGEMRQERSKFPELVGEYIVALKEESIGRTGLMDITWIFSNGWRLQIFDPDPTESWFLEIDNWVLRAP